MTEIMPVPRNLNFTVLPAGGFWLPVLLPFQKIEILIDCRSAQIAHPCQFRHIQLLVSVSGIVAEEHGGNIVCRCLWSADLRTLALAFAIPDRTRSRMIRNSNSANTPDIWIKAFVIGSI